MIHAYWRSLQRFVLRFPLHKNADQNKIIKSIQTLEKSNKYIKYENKIGGIGTNKTLSFTIKDNALIVSWSHLYVKDICDVKYYKEVIMIMILPENTDEKYIRAVYIH